MCAAIFLFGACIMKGFVSTVSSAFLVFVIYWTLFVPEAGKITSYFNDNLKTWFSGMPWVYLDISKTDLLNNYSRS